MKTEISQVISAKGAAFIAAWGDAPGPMRPKRRALKAQFNFWHHFVSSLPRH